MLECCNLIEDIINELIFFLRVVDELGIILIGNDFCHFPVEVIDKVLATFEFGYLVFNGDSVFIRVFIQKSSGFSCEDTVLFIKVVHCSAGSWPGSEKTMGCLLLEGWFAKGISLLLFSSALNAAVRYQVGGFLFASCDSEASFLILPSSLFLNNLE